MEGSSGPEPARAGMREAGRDSGSGPKVNGRAGVGPDAGAASPIYMPAERSPPGAPPSCALSGTAPMEGSAAGRAETPCPRTGVFPASGGRRGSAGRAATKPAGIVCSTAAGPASLTGGTLGSAGEGAREDERGSAGSAASRPPAGSESVGSTMGAAGIEAPGRAAEGTTASKPSKMWAHWMQRMYPLRSCSCSRDTEKTVSHCGQRVVSSMAMPNVNPGVPGRAGRPSRREPARLRAPATVRRPRRLPAPGVPARRKAPAPRRGRHGWPAWGPAL